MLNSSPNLDKVPPQDVDAERAVLGAMMMQDEHNTESIVRIIDIIGDTGKGIFYRASHLAIYRAIIDLFNRGESADLLTVTKELQRQGKLEGAGGVPYLDEMIDSVPTSANADRYAKIIMSEAKRRNGIYLGHRLQTDLHDQTKDADETLDKAADGLMQIINESNNDDVIHIKKALNKGMKQIQQVYENGSNIIGVPSGFNNLDKATAGFKNAEYSILAARPSMGKSSLAKDIAINAAKAKYPVAYFNLETSHTEFVLRVLSSESDIDHQNLQTGFIKQESWEDIAKAASMISELPIALCFDRRLTPTKARAKIIKAGYEMKKDHGEIKLVIIDYLQLMSGASPPYATRNDEVSDISKTLKSIAVELDVPMLVLSQLNRNPESRQDKRPVLADLRESGSIEQDADTVMFLYRENYYDNDIQDNTTELIIGKQRNGPRKTLYLNFHGDRMKFTPV